MSPFQPTSSEVAQTPKSAGGTSAALTDAVAASANCAPPHRSATLGSEGSATPERAQNSSQKAAAAAATAAAPLPPGAAATEFASAAAAAEGSVSFVNASSSATTTQKTSSPATCARADACIVPLKVVALKLASSAPEPGGGTSATARAAQTGRATAVVFGPPADAWREAAIRAAAARGGTPTQSIGGVPGAAPAARQPADIGAGIEPA